MPVGSGPVPVSDLYTGPCVYVDVGGSYAGSMEKGLEDPSLVFLKALTGGVEQRVNFFFPICPVIASAGMSRKEGGCCS